MTDEPGERMGTQSIDVGGKAERVPLFRVSWSSIPRWECPTCKTLWARGVGHCAHCKADRDAKNSRRRMKSKRADVVLGGDTEFEGAFDTEGS